MSTTISRGRIFRITVSIDDKRMEQLKNAPQAVEHALQQGADWWHTNVLPKHFRKEAHDYYGYAKRSIKYLKSKHGKPDLVQSGSMARELKSRATFRMVGGAMELGMYARALNLAPAMPQNSMDLYVPRRKGRGYPNLKREIKALTMDEHETLSQIVAHALEIAFGDTEGRESDD